jgi:hypothetical protein
MKKKPTRRLEKSKENHATIECPYLFSSSKRICWRMVEAGIDGEVSSFDIKHFCRGNPTYCYYFRSSPSYLMIKKLKISHHQKGFT